MHAPQLSACVVCMHHQAMDKHKCAPAAAVALGRGLLGTVLMGSFKKDGEATQVQGIEMCSC